ncbi:MAG: hypothetical protein P4L53_27480 [Candidatus Obscuribacterales bacterium]|nr:hypothetical protein [Candidatus Obscuribacterales bacterium]
MVHSYHQSDSAEGSQISGELRHHQYGQARHELTSELHSHPREFQQLLHQISNDLIAHHYKPLSVEHDRNNNITGINFHHHNIYNGLGQESHESRRTRHGLSGETTADTSHRPLRGRHGRPHDDREESFAPPARQGRDGRVGQEDELRPGEIRNPFAEMGHDIERGLDRAGHAIGDAAKKFGDDLGEAARTIGHGLEHISQEVGDKMARLAVRVAESLGTVGDCAHGPRIVFDKMGFHLPPMMATEQGRRVRESGLFDEVSPKDVRPGDYGVRNWSNHVIRQHGYNAGDSFIVASNHRGNIVQANDHIQNIDRRGRYADVHFYRPNARMLAMMQEKGLV